MQPMGIARMGVAGRIREELPSLLLLMACYAAFIALTVFADRLGIAAATGLLVPVLVLHSSLQHEFIHGHPTSSRAFNHVLVYLPLGLFIPYLRFMDTHLAHHVDPRLTDPYDDPESNFFDPKIWRRLPRWRKMLANWNNTLFGRMAIGPFFSLLWLYRGDLIEITKPNLRIIAAYLHHAIGLILLLVWLSAFTSLPFWALAIAGYLALSALKIRTFLEHMAHERVAARSVVIEDRGILALLFLNNNYHSIHHLYPHLAWHKLPARYQARREKYLRRNGGYWFRSYGSVFRLYFFRQKDPVPHPLMHGFEPGQNAASSDHQAMKAAAAEN